MNKNQSIPDPEKPLESSGSAFQVAEELRQVVRRSNRRWKRLILLETIAWLIAAPLGYLWVVFLLDNILHLPVIGRVLAIAFFSLILIGFLAHCLRQWRQARFTDDQVALAIERRTAVPMENRLINLIQLSRDTGSQPLSQAAVAENYRHLQRIRLEQAARSFPALLYSGIALLLVMIGVMFWAFQREQFTNAATRIFLPFARVAPVYRTLLDVQPGDIRIKQGEDVTIRVRIEGNIPAALAIFRQINDRRTSEEIPVPKGADQISYTFKAVAQSFDYAVRGGDYVSPFYTIEIPVPCELKRLESVLHYPAYIRQPDRKQENTAGDLEALAGTRADLRFIFSQPIAEAAMLVEIPPIPAGDASVTNPAANLRRIPLTLVSATEFSGALTFQDLSGYRLEMVAPGQPANRSRKYDLRVLADLPPDLQLSGIDAQTEMAADSAIPVTIIARDDYGLTEAGIFFRAVTSSSGPVAAEPADASATASVQSESTNAWQALQAWPVANQALLFQTNLTLSAQALNIAEGDTVELAARGRDNDPLKKGQWTAGPSLSVTIGGAGTALQRIYEQILQTEADLRAVIQSHEKEVERDGQWVRKLDPDSGLRWDDKKNNDELAAAMREQARSQAELREKSSGIARRMVEEAGDLRLAVGMLADTEMIRAVRMFESVAGKDAPREKRSVLADARLTQERIIRSLREMLDQYILFRQDWELSNMVPFVKMLAERQQRMVGESGAYAGLPPAAAPDAALRKGANRRQLKLLKLAGLAQTAFAGIGGRVTQLNPALAKAFTGAAADFDAAGAGVKPTMRKAADCLEGGQWVEAATNQQSAVTALVAIHARLIKVQADAVQQALAEVKNLAAESAEAQKEIARLQAGTNQNALLFNPDQADLGEVIRMQKMAEELKKKKQTRGQDGKFDYLFGNARDSNFSSRPTNTDFSILSLATNPSGQVSSPNFSDRAPNSAKIDPITEKFQDLVGDLLEEADDLREKYETYNVSLPGQGVEKGDIGKQAGDLNAINAAAATGNMKPPTQNIGGASRSGRQGARAHGTVIGDESVNRRGRDEVQEGQESVADQAGKLKETKSGDVQKDASTGVGGKEVDTEESSFSEKNAGEWKDDMVSRLKAPKDKNKIVERQGKALHPQVAEMMRDLTSTQEQMIERIKAIKKQLDNLYLPTDHLDEMAAELDANLERLRQSPDAEIFRMQMETLDKLKGAIVVFNRPASDFQPSLAQPQAVRGQILDEPPWPTMPGYEEAVKHYYENLALP